MIEEKSTMMSFALTDFTINTLFYNLSIARSTDSILSCCSIKPRPQSKYKAWILSDYLLWILSDYLLWILSDYLLTTIENTLCQ